MVGRARATQGRLRADLPDSRPGRRAATGRPGDSGQSAGARHYGHRPRSSHRMAWPAIPTATAGNPHHQPPGSTAAPCPRQRPILAEYRIDRKSVLDGLTDEYHITARPPHAATERRRSRPNRISEPHRMIQAVNLVGACQLPQSGCRAMVHADIVVAFCDDRTIERQLGVRSWAASSSSSSSLWQWAASHQPSCFSIGRP
jgi:hypothetical protein